jgi:hypothetical protein
MKLQAKGIEFTDRDIDFFRYLHSVKVATYEQIQRDIYIGYKVDSVGKRLRRFENNGFLKTNRARTLLGGRVLVTITKKGFTSFVKDGLERRIELKSDAVLHDISLVDLRYRLIKQQRIKKYLTENVLQTWGYILDDYRYSNLVELNSDALIDIEFPRATLKVPFEYDACQKAANRYEDVFSKYYRRDDVQIVLYVCKKESTMNQLMKLEKKELKSNQPKFFYALKQDILENEVSKFKNCKNHALTL